MKRWYVRKQEIRAWANKVLEPVPFWVVVLFWVVVAALYFKCCYVSPLEPSPSDYLE